jgi:soluble lytic murein transglycosylase-like protein
MQLMPATAREMGYNPRIPEENVHAGARYLRMLLDKYQDSRDWLRSTIAAYNAGPGAVDRHRGVPPYRETRTYVTRVLSYLKYYHNAE